MKFPEEVYDTWTANLEGLQKDIVRFYLDNPVNTLDMGLSENLKTSIGAYLVRTRLQSGAATVMQLFEPCNIKYSDKCLNRTAIMEDYNNGSIFGKLVSLPDVLLEPMYLEEKE